MRPILTVDVIIKYKEGVVLIKRKTEPFLHYWAIPGGHVEYNETIEEAAKREVKEETNLNIRNLEQFHVYSDPKRDPRGHYVSVVFTAQGVGRFKNSEEVEDIRVFDKIPENIAFDHKIILTDYFKNRR